MPATSSTRFKPRSLDLALLATGQAIASREIISRFDSHSAAILLVAALALGAAGTVVLSMRCERSRAELLMAGAFAIGWATLLVGYLDLGFLSGRAPAVSQLSVLVLLVAGVVAGAAFLHTHLSRHPITHRPMARR